MEEQIDYVGRFYALDDAIFKSLGNMIWVSMPESVQKGRSVRRRCVPKFFPSQRHHDVCCMMTAEELVDYVSPDVIHEILTTEPLREEFWSRVELELELKEINSVKLNCDPTFYYKKDVATVKINSIVCM